MPGAPNSFLFLNQVCRQATPAHATQLPSGRSCCTTPVEDQRLELSASGTKQTDLEKDKEPVLLLRNDETCFFFRGCALSVQPTSAPK